MTRENQKRESLIKNKLLQNNLSKFNSTNECLPIEHKSEIEDTVEK